MAFFLDDVLSRRTRALPRVSLRGVSADKVFHGLDVEISSIYGWNEIVLFFVPPVFTVCQRILKILNFFNSNKLGVYGPEFSKKQ